MVRGTVKVASCLAGAVLIAAGMAPGWLAMGVSRAQDRGAPARAGANHTPVLTAHFAGNRTFLWPGVPLEYLVIASDPEDGDTLSGRIDPERVAVAFDHIKKSEPVPVPKPVPPDLLKKQASGRRLIGASDCVLCHAVSGDRPIPTYARIAEFHDGRGDAMATLAAKVITGGSGVWGETVMPPHPQVSIADARTMVLYILSLAKPEARRPWLPARGVIEANGLGDAVGGTPDGTPDGKTPFGDHAPGRYLFWATYTDRGSTGRRGAGAPRSAHVAVPFRAPLLLAADRDGGRKLRDVDGAPGLRFAVPTSRRAVLRYDKIDLTGVRALGLFVGNDKESWAGGRIEIRLGSAIGKVIGRAKVAPDGGPASIKRVPAALAPVRGLQSLFVVLRGGAGNRRGPVALAAIAFER